MHVRIYAADQLICMTAEALIGDPEALRQLFQHRALVAEPWPQITATLRAIEVHLVSTYLSICPPVCLATYPSVDLSIYLLITYLLLTCSSTYLPTSLPTLLNPGTDSASETYLPLPIYHPTNLGPKHFALLSNIPLVMITIHWGEPSRNHPCPLKPRLNKGGVVEAPNTKRAQ